MNVLFTLYKFNWLKNLQQQKNSMFCAAVELKKMFKKSYCSYQIFILTSYTITVLLKGLNNYYTN